MLLFKEIMKKTSKLHHWVNIGNFIVKFENVFACWEKFWKTLHGTTSKNLGSFQEKYLRWISVIVKSLPFRFTVILLMFRKLVILWNFFIMVYEALLLILVSSQPYLNLEDT